MKTWIEIAITIFCSVSASSGFWMWLNKRADKKDARTKLLLGLCHDRVITQGVAYLERGYLTNEEYVNIVDCLSVPYFELGGNGAGHKIIDEVKKLPIRGTVIEKH